jgi:hypothetical protein
LLIDVNMKTMKRWKNTKRSFASSFTSSPLTFLHVSIKNQTKALFTSFVMIQALFSTSDNLYLIVDRCKHEDNEEMEEY